MGRRRNRPKNKDLKKTLFFKGMLVSDQAPEGKSGHAHQKFESAKIDVPANSAATPADKVSALEGVKVNPERPLLAGNIENPTAAPPHSPASSEIEVSDTVSKTQADQASPTEGDNAKRGDDSQPKAAEKESADPSPPRKHSEPEIIQMLSEALAQQASELTGEDIKWEKGRRHNVAKALARHSIDELEAGRLLFEYRKAYKVKRRWTVLAQKIGKVIDCSHRTIYRMVDKYEASVTRPREQDPKINRKEICGVRLSESEKRERNARLAVRAFLNNFPATKRGEKLADLLAEEAYQVWGIFEPFPIEIKIEPRRSRFTIDGRKKVQPPRVMEKTLASQVQEVAA